MTAEEKKVRRAIVKDRAKKRAKARAIIQKRAEVTAFKRDLNHKDRLAGLRGKGIVLQAKRRVKSSRRAAKTERFRKFVGAWVGSKGSPRTLPCAQTTGDVHRARRLARTNGST